MKLGYYDIVMFPHTRHFKDLYHLWDGVCKTPVKLDIPIPGKPGMVYVTKSDTSQFHLVFLQFKTGYASSEDKEEMRKFCQLGGVMGLLAEWVPKQVKYARKKGSYTKHELKITRW